MLIIEEPANFLKGKKGFANKSESISGRKIS